MYNLSVYYSYALHILTDTRETIMTLFNTITEILAVYDQQTIDSQIASIPARRQAKKEIWQQHGVKKFGNVYSVLFDAVGGKGWYQLLDWSTADIAEKITKREKANAEARNAKIALKLEKIGVAEIVDANPVYSNSGFVGTWVVKSDKGNFKVSVDVILAGGYNIQCLHNRVLVSVK